ncbi:DUF6231 family protein [Thiobacter aerophilum]|uniref:DUF6231 family protein n=1 Tax=Thiobacter aerophilum TaxID=3121275 RepID=A0ABV0EI49_9BURK
MSNASTQDTLELTTLVTACRARSLLVLGRLAGPLPTGCALTHHAAPPWLPADNEPARFDLVYVIDVLEGLAKVEGVRLLCRLRDVHTPRLYVRCVLGEWGENDFFALGMERLALKQRDGQTSGLFRFDLFTYKPAPEWFNAKYWAHPELWDKYPWLSS